MIKVRTARISCCYLYVEIDFGVQKTDKFLINGMAGSVDRDTGHIAINC